MSVRSVRRPGLLAIYLVAHHHQTGARSCRRAWHSEWRCRSAAWGQLFNGGNRCPQYCPRIQATLAGRNWKENGPKGRKLQESLVDAGLCWIFVWSRRQESNLYLPLRRRPFYPLNYDERGAKKGEWSCSQSPRRALVRREAAQTVCGAHSTKAALQPGSSLRRGGLAPRREQVMPAASAANRRASCSCTADRAPSALIDKRSCSASQVSRAA